MGAPYITNTSLAIQLVNEAGVPILKANLTKEASELYTARFSPPSFPFRLQLSGKTKQGFPFQRVTPEKVRAKPAVIRIVTGKDDMRFQLGNTLYILFKIYNVGRSEAFDIDIKDNVGFLKPLHLVRFVSHNTQRSILVLIRPTKRGYNKGRVDEVFAKAKGKISKVVLDISKTFLMG